MRHYISQRKIVSNIFKFIVIMCLRTGKYRKNVQRQITYIFLQKWRSFLIVISEPHWKTVNPTVKFFWVYH